MMKINILCVGKIKEKFFQDAQAEYLKRLSRFATINVVEVPDVQIPENASIKEEEIVKQKEFDEVLRRLDKNTYVVALDLKGKQYDSLEFSEKIKNYQVRGYSNITFIIAGSLGYPQGFDKYVNEKLKLSEMTFVHQMARIILLEQIYRSFKILNNETYHK